MWEEGLQPFSEDGLHFAPSFQASTVDVTITIPHKYHNAIIGPKGRLVRSVMDECGVRIYFPSSSSKSDEVKLSGPPEDVERAKTILEEMASETALESHCLELKAKPEFHKFLIGRNGANIKKVCRGGRVECVGGCGGGGGSVQCTHPIDVVTPHL